MKKIITLTAFACLAFLTTNAHAQPTCQTLGYNQSASDCSGKQKIACPTDETKFFCLEQCDETIYKYDSINCPSSKNVLGGEKCGDKYSKCTCTSNAVEVFPGDYTLCAEYDSCTSKCIKLGDCRTLGSQWKSYKYFSGTTGTSRLKSECQAVVKNSMYNIYERCYASGRSLQTSADYAKPNGWKIDCVRCMTAADVSAGKRVDAMGGCTSQ